MWFLALDRQQRGLLKVFSLYYSFKQKYIQTNIKLTFRKI